MKIGLFCSEIRNLEFLLNTDCEWKLTKLNLDCCLETLLAAWCIKPLIPLLLHCYCTYATAIAFMFLLLHCCHCYLTDVTAIAPMSLLLHQCHCFCTDATVIALLSQLLHRCNCTDVTASAPM